MEIINLTFNEKQFNNLRDIVTHESIRVQEILGKNIKIKTQYMLDFEYKNELCTEIQSENVIELYKDKRENLIEIENIFRYTTL